MYRNVKHSETHFIGGQTRCSFSEIVQKNQMNGNQLNPKRKQAIIALSYIMFHVTTFQVYNNSFCNRLSCIVKNQTISGVVFPIVLRIWEYDGICYPYLTSLRASDFQMFMFWVQIFRLGSTQCRVL